MSRKPRKAASTSGGKKIKSGIKASVRSADIDVKLAPGKVEDFLACVRRTGKLRLSIRYAGETPIPPEILSVVDAQD